MLRKFRAAHLFAAAAFCAVTSFATPAAAQDLPKPLAPINAVKADVTLAVGVATANPIMAPANAFTGLFGKAVSAIADVGHKLMPHAPVIPVAQRSLDELVSTYVAPPALDADQDCLASAVYFEARGESLEGQLAVAQVVLNRAASGRYPPDVCEVVTQKAQFSFVRHGHIPDADRSCDAWRKAVAIAEIAREKLVASVPQSVLWYHADYVSPSWGSRLNKFTQIGAHIFYG